MARVLFLGGLVRFYSGAPGWKAPQIAVNAGLDDPEIAQKAVELWRHWVNKALADEGVALDWNESPTSPWEVREVDDCFLSELMVAAKENEEASRPNTWFPFSGGVVFCVNGVAEEEIIVGTLAALIDGLSEIDQLSAGAASVRADLLELADRGIRFGLPLRLI